MEPDFPTRLRRAFMPGPGLMTVVLTMTMLLFVLTNIVEANWVRGLDVLRGVGMGGIIVGAILARWWRGPRFLAHLLSLGLGVAWVISRMDLDPRLATFGDRVNDMLIRTLVWFRAAQSNKVINDYYLFVLLGLLAAWMLGYITIWWLLRKGWPWRALLLNGTIIMTNLTYASPKSRTSFWFFLVTGLLLIVFETFRSRQQRWQAAALEQQEFMSLRFLWAGIVACTLLVIVAAMLPATITNAQLRVLADRLSNPFDRIGTALGLPGTGSGSSAATQPARATFSRTSVQLGGSRVATNRPVLEVRSTSREYWRSNAWDFYNGVGWENTTGRLAQQSRSATDENAALTAINAGTVLPQLDTQGRTYVTQTFTLIQSRGDQQLPAATAPYSWSLPILAQHTFIGTPGGEEDLPNYTDAAIFFNQGAANAGLSYTVVSLVSDADKLSLRQSTTDYPPWVRRYLQVPESADMNRIAVLARQITAGAGADNPYDKAIAAERYLRAFPYDDQIPAPPAGIDPVAYFLFDLQRGYCDYFASSMVLMLRLQGVPARWVQGYATGDFDPEKGAYVVRDTVAHSWPEVYFNGYGWVRFEPTPAGYVTVPFRSEFPAGFEEDDIGPNAGIVNPVRPDFERLQELRDDLSQVTPVPLPPLEALPPFNLTFTEPASPVWRWVFWGVVVLVVLGLLVWLLIQREIRGLRPAARSYALVGQLARWAGLQQPAEATPHQYAEQLSQQLPNQRAAIERLTDSYIYEQYGRLPKVDPQHLRDDTRQIGRPLARRAVKRSWRSLAETLLRQRKRSRRDDADF